MRCTKMVIYTFAWDEAEYFATLSGTYMFLRYTFLQFLQVSPHHGRPTLGELVHRRQIHSKEIPTGPTNHEPRLLSATRMNETKTRI